jgi:hypothetical protein
MLCVLTVLQMLALNGRLEKSTVRISPRQSCPIACHIPAASIETEWFTFCRCALNYLQFFVVYLEQPPFLVAIGHSYYRRFNPYHLHHTVIAKLFHLFIIIRLLAGYLLLYAHLVIASQSDLNSYKKAGYS